MAPQHPESAGSCPPFADLLAALEGGAAEEVDRHCATCASCEARRDHLRALLGLLESARRERVSDAALTEALAIPDRVAGEGGGALKSLIARLLPTPAASPRPAFRGGGDAAGTLQVYQAGPYELELERLGSGAVVGTFVLPEESDATLSGVSCVLSGSGETYECALRPGGRFRLTDVPAGSYTLFVESDAFRVVVPDVTFAD